MGLKEGGKTPSSSSSSSSSGVWPAPGSVVREKDSLRSQDLKHKGNGAFQDGKYADAVQLFSAAILCNPVDHLLYSNRAAAWAKLQRHVEALDDAECCVRLCPGFAKGWGRKGHAEYCLGRWADAEKSYEAGLRADPANRTLLSSLAQLRQRPAPNRLMLLFACRHLDLGSLFEQLNDADKLTADFVSSNEEMLNSQLHFLAHMLHVDSSLMRGPPDLTDAYDQATFACGQLVASAPAAASRLNVASMVARGLGCALRVGWDLHHGVAKFAAHALCALAVCKDADSGVRSIGIQMLLSGLVRWLVDGRQAEPGHHHHDQVCGCSCMRPRLSAACWIDRLFQIQTPMPWLIEEVESFPDVEILTAWLVVAVRDGRGNPIGLTFLLQVPGVAKRLMQCELDIDFYDIPEPPISVSSNSKPALGATSQANSSSSSKPAAAPGDGDKEKPTTSDDVELARVLQAEEDAKFQSNFNVSQLRIPRLRIGEWIMGSLGYLLLFIHGDPFFSIQAMKCLLKLIAADEEHGLERLLQLWLAIPLLEELSALSCHHVAGLELLQKAAAVPSAHAAIRALANALAKPSEEHDKDAELVEMTNRVETAKEELEKVGVNEDNDRNDSYADSATSESALRPESGEFLEPVPSWVEFFNELIEQFTLTDLSNDKEKEEEVENADCNSPPLLNLMNFNLHVEDIVAKRGPSKSTEGPQSDAVPSQSEDGVQNSAASSELPQNGAVPSEVSQQGAASPEAWLFFERVGVDVAQAWSLLELAQRAAETRGNHEEAAAIRVECEGLLVRMRVPEKRVWLHRRLHRHHRGALLEAVGEVDTHLAFVEWDREADGLGALRRQFLEGTGLASSDLTGEFEVRFKNESATGSSVFREWLDLLAVQVFLNPKHRLMRPTPDGAFYRPDQAAPFVNPSWRIDYELLGRLMGLAVWHDATLTLPLHPQFCRLLLQNGERCELQDGVSELEALDPEAYQHKVAWLLHNSVDMLGFDLTFVDTLESDHLHEDRDGSSANPDLDSPALPDCLDATKDRFSGDTCTEDVRLRRVNLGATVQLEENGEALVVTDANKQRFLSALAQWRLFGSMQPALESILHGFCTVVPKAVLAEMSQMMSAEEFGQVLSGLPGIDVKDWEQNTEYVGGLSASSTEVQLFWQCLRTWDATGQLERLQSLLQFATGSRRVAVGGFAHLQGFRGGRHRFSLSRAAHLTSSSLPTAHACICTLDLPPYEDLKTTEEKLLLALELGSQNFDEAAVSGHRPRASSSSNAFIAQQSAAATNIIIDDDEDINIDDDEDTPLQY